MLEFEVNCLSLEEIKQDNKALLKLYFTFHWTEAASQSYEIIKHRILELFKPLPQGRSYMANWTTTMARNTTFEELMPELKKHVLLGSVEGYEVFALTGLYE